MQLKIFSLNCWLLPTPYSVRNHTRLAKIISLIKEHHPDIIALQEVWQKKHVKLIEKELPDYFFIKSDSGLFNKTGLVTGTLIKPKSTAIHFFPLTKNHIFSEKLAKKGYHIIELTPGFFIINTHLYAIKDSIRNHIAKSQFKILETLCTSKKCILIGDLNMKEKDLAKLNTIYNLEPLSYLTASNVKPHMQILFNKHLDAVKKIDYILKTKKSKMRISTKCLNFPIISDHRIILGTIDD